MKTMPEETRRTGRRMRRLIFMLHSGIRINQRLAAKVVKLLLRRPTEPTVGWKLPLAPPPACNVIPRKGGMDARRGKGQGGPASHPGTSQCLALFWSTFPVLSSSLWVSRYLCFIWSNHLHPTKEDSKEIVKTVQIQR